jgi:hypothetical protein
MEWPLLPAKLLNTTIPKLDTGIGGSHHFTLEQLAFTTTYSLAPRPWHALISLVVQQLLFILCSHVLLCIT